MTGIFKYFIIKQFSCYTLVLFSAVLLFIINGCEEDDELVAVRSIETIEPYISGPAVISGGVVKANRKIELLGYGVCYSTINPKPSIDDAVAAGTDLTVSREGGGYLMEFESEMILSPGTYYLRAYIDTRSGIAYGNERVFTFN